MERSFSKSFWHPSLLNFSPSSVVALILLSEKGMDWQTNQLQKGYRKTMLAVLKKTESTIDNIIKDLRKNEGIIKARDGKEYVNPYLFTKSPTPQTIIDYLEGKINTISGIPSPQIAKEQSKQKKEPFRAKLIDPSTLF
jgi:hypothetical protein